MVFAIAFDILGVRLSWPSSNSFEFSISNGLEETTMGYNHRSAEKAWIKWKELEEEKLRNLGVSEETIQQLREYDRAEFNAERNFRRWQVSTDESIQEQQKEMEDLPITNAESLLDGIENEQLLAVLRKTDKLTLEMLTLKMQGYSAEEICRQFHVSPYSYYNRIKRFKQKIKKFFSSD